MRSAAWIAAIAALALLGHVARAESEAPMSEEAPAADGFEDVADVEDVESAEVDADGEESQQGAEEQLAPVPGTDGTGPSGSESIHAGTEIHALHEEMWKGSPKELTPDQHGDFVRSHENALVLLTGKRCYLCRRINREFVRAEWLARSTEVPVALATIDVESPEGTALMKRLNVGALPVMFLTMNHGKERVFIEHWWAAEPLVSDVQIKLGQMHVVEPVRELEQVSDIAAWLFDRGNDQGTFETTALLMVPNPEPFSSAIDLANVKCKAEFDEASRAIAHDATLAFKNRPRFAQSSSREVAASFGLPVDRPSIVVYKDFDEGKAVFPGACTGEPDAMREFILAESTPRVVIAHHGNIREHRSRQTNVAHVFVPGQTLDDGRATQPILAALREAARILEEKQVAQRGELMFFLSNGHQYHSWMAEYGLKQGVLPALGVDMVERERRYAAPKLTGARVIPSVEELAANDTAEVDTSALPTPDPATGLLPEKPVDPNADVSVDSQELAAAIAAVVERNIKPFAVYGEAAKKAKKAKKAKRAKKAAKKPAEKQDGKA